MKVFISWSGQTSHKVAKVLRDWLPSVIQSIRPYVSSEDIDKGARWSSDIAGELDAASFGILCLTPDNISAPWINFEAGALGKSVEKSKVCPFLFDLQRSDVDGPLLQFQSTVFEKDDVFKLIQSMNFACGAETLEETRLQRTFEVWWPNLEASLASIPKNIEPEEIFDKDNENQKLSKVIEEILELSRSNHKILRDPSSLLPSEYLEHAWIKSRKRNDIHPDALKDIIRVAQAMRKIVKDDFFALPSNEQTKEIIGLVEELDDISSYIMRRSDISFRLNKRIRVEM